MAKETDLWDIAMRSNPNDFEAFRKITDRIATIIAKELSGNSLEKTEALYGLQGLHLIVQNPPGRDLEDLLLDARCRLDFARVHHCIKKLNEMEKKD